MSAIIVSTTSKWTFTRIGDESAFRWKNFTASAIPFSMCQRRAYWATMIATGVFSSLVMMMKAGFSWPLPRMMSWRIGFG